MDRAKAANLITAFVVILSTALLSWYVAEGGAARAAWKKSVAQTRADRYLTLTIDSAYRGYEPPALGAAQLRRLGKAPGVQSVAWASAVLFDASSAHLPYRLVSQGYPRAKRLRLVAATPGRPALDLKAGETLISRAQAQNVFASDRAAVGRRLTLAGSERLVAGVYAGAGPALVAGTLDDIETLPEHTRGVREVYLETRGPAPRSLRAVLRWARSHSAIPKGLTLETMASVLRPDRAVVRNPYLNALRWVGSGVALAMLLLVVFSLATGIVIQLRAGERRRVLRLIWGAPPGRIVAEEALSFTLRTLLYGLLGALAGLLAARLCGGVIDTFSVGVLALTLLILTIASIIPVLLSARPRNAYSALARSLAGARAQSVALLAKLAVFASALVLTVSILIAMQVRAGINEQIRALGAGIYMLYPDHESSSAKPMRILQAADLDTIRSRWPGLPAVLLSNFTGSALRSPGEPWVKVNVRASLGDYWDVVAQTPSLGDAGGIVVTKELKRYLGKTVQLRIGPSEDNVVTCAVSGVVDAVKTASNESPRLKPGWLWVDAGGECWPRTFRAPVAAIRATRDVGDPDALSAQVAAFLSAQRPNQKPLKAKSVVANAESTLARLNRLLVALGWQLVGLVTLSLLGVVLIAAMFARAWVMVFALHRALGSSRGGLLVKAVIHGMGWVLAPAVIGAAAGLGAFILWVRDAASPSGLGLGQIGLVALLVGLAAAALGLAAGGLAGRAALAAPPARWLLREDT